MTKQHLIEAYQTLVSALEEADKQGLYGFDFSTRETRNKLLQTFDGMPTSDSRSKGLTAIFDLSSKEHREALVEIAPQDEKGKIEKLLQRLQGYRAPEVFNPASQPSIEVNAGDLADAIDTFAAVAKTYKGLVIWLRLKGGRLHLSSDTNGVQVSRSIAAKGQGDWSLMLEWDAKPNHNAAGKLLQGIAARFGEKTERSKSLTLSRTRLDLNSCRFTVSWGRGSSSQACLDAWDENSEDAKKASMEPPAGSEKITITPRTVQRLVRLVKNAPYTCDADSSYYLCGPHFPPRANDNDYSEVIVADRSRFSVFGSDFDGKNTLSGVTVPWTVFRFLENFDPESNVTVARFAQKRYPNNPSIDIKNDYIWFSDEKTSVLTQTLESITSNEYPAKFLLDFKNNQDERLKPVNIERNHLLDAVSVLEKSAQGFLRVVISFLPDKGMFLYCDSFVDRAAEYASTVSGIIKKGSPQEILEGLQKFGLNAEIKKQPDNRSVLDVLPVPGSKSRKKITLTSANFDGPWLVESKNLVETSHFIVWNFKPKTYAELDQRVGASIPASAFRGTVAHCTLSISYLIEALKSFEDKNDPTTFEFPRDYQNPAVITIGSIRHFIMPIRDEGASSDFATEVARDALGLGEGDEIPFITEPSFGAKKTAKPKASKPKPAPAPEDTRPKTSKPKPVPAPEDAPKATKPAAKPAPAAKTASQQMEEFAEMFDGKERAEMLAQARVMREVEEIVRLAAEARSLGLGAFANTMNDLAALMGG